MVGRATNFVEACMWVFGYGSLMWDSWEQQFNCVQRRIAELHGYSRSFSKASVKNWGSATSPGPTLNLDVAESAVCTGIVFEFKTEQEGDVTAYLARREGKGFELKPKSVVTDGGESVDALVPIYIGHNVIRGESLVELARRVANAKGTSGQCREYVRGVQLELNRLGISDPVVTEIWNAIERIA